MSNINKPKKKSKILLLAIAALAIYFGYHIVKNLAHRLGNKPVSIEQAAGRALETLQNDAQEVGFEEAQERARERGNARLDGLKTTDKVIAAALGFFGIEYKLAESYEAYCKNHGVLLPNMRKYTYNLNKPVHDKAVALLDKHGISEEDIKNNILIPLEPQLLQAIEMELTSIIKDTGQTIKDLCEELERTAPQNKTLEVRTQNPTIVEIIENN